MPDSKKRKNELSFVEKLQLVTQVVHRPEDGTVLVFWQSRLREDVLRWPDRNEHGKDKLYIGPHVHGLGIVLEILGAIVGEKFTTSPKRSTSERVVYIRHSQWLNEREPDLRPTGPDAETWPPPPLEN